MNQCIGIIKASKTSDDYKSLCKERPAYMLPFGGRYRLIDFALTNMSIYNLANVVLYGEENLRSTMDHIGDGKSWELNRRQNGLMILPPRFDYHSGEKNEIETYFHSLPFYYDSSSEDIFLVDPMILAAVNIRVAYDLFKEKDLDVLLLYSRMEDPQGKHINADKLILGHDGSLINIGMNLGTEPEFNLYLQKAFMKKEVFIELIKNAKEKGDAKTLKQALLNNKSRLKIGTMEIDAHVERIHDIKSYYDANMNLLDPDIYYELFYKGGTILTKSKDEPSTLYEEGSRVENSLVANGCIIEGQVENSIIFRGVKIGKGAIVKNSILIQKTEIGEDAVVVNTIADKYAKVEKGVTVTGAVNQPFIIEKSQVIR